MAQQTRRAPGRPKKTQDEIVVENVAPAQEPAKKASRPSIKQKQNETRHRVYEIPKGGGIVTIIRQKEIQVYDENLGKIRNLRYCPR